MSVAEKYLEGLQALVRKTEQVVGAAGSGDWDVMLAGLEERQGLIAAIDQLAAGPGQLSPQQQAVAKRLLERMVTLDQDVSQQVTVALANTRAAMDEARLAQTTVSAYRKTLSPAAQAYPAKFVDTHK